MADLGPPAKSLLGKTFDLAKDQLNRIDAQQAATDAKAFATKGFEAAKAGAANIDVKELALAAKDQLSRVDAQQAANSAKALATKGFEAAKTGAANIDVKAIPGAAKDWAVEHPYQASFHAATGVVLLAPAIVTMPVLGAVGFGATGVTAGSSAAAFQAGVGNVAAQSGFACMQSAAMGGYGLGVVNGVAQGVAVVAQAVGAGVGIRRGQQQQRGQEGGGDGEEGVGAGESEDDGLDPRDDDGTVDMEDEVAVEDVKSKL